MSFIGMEMRKKYYYFLCSVLILIYHSTASDGACEGDDTCKCQTEECRFIGAAPRGCKTVEDACSGMKFKENQCQRKGAYYSWGGAVCKHDKDAGNCDDYDNLIIAINFGGKEHTAVDGITYETDPNITDPYLHDPRGMKRKYEKMNFNIEGIPEVDRYLYESHVTADGSEVNFGAHVSYELPLQDLPGEYELTLKFVEPVHDKPFQRNFGVKINHLWAMNGQDIVSYSGKKGAVFTLHVPFTIKKEGTDSYLYLFGQDVPQQVHHESGPLAFQAGECGDDITFVASAMSLKYLGPNWSPPGKTETTKDMYKKKNGKARKKRAAHVCKAKHPTTKAPKAKTTTSKKPEESEEGGPIGGRSFG